VYFNAYSQTLDQSTKNQIRKQKGYTNITEIDLAFGQVNVVEVGTNENYYLGLQTINGYQFSPYFSMGVGVGCNRYANYTLRPGRNGNEYLWKGGGFEIPVFLDIRVNFINNSLTPFMSVDAGYSFPIGYDYFYGGFFVNPSFGVKHFISAKTAFNVSIGYRYYSNTFDLYSWGHYIPLKQIYNLFTLKTGFTF
jgi:hypothetical protein